MLNVLDQMAVISPFVVNVQKSEGFQRIAYGLIALLKDIQGLISPGTWPLSGMQSRAGKHTS